MLDEITSCTYRTVLDAVFGCEKSGFSRLFGTLQDILISNYPLFCYDNKIAAPSQQSDSS